MIVEKPPAPRSTSSTRCARPRPPPTASSLWCSSSAPARPPRTFGSCSGGCARPSARRDVRDALVPRRGLFRRAVARQVGDRGWRHDAGPRHPSARSARLPARRLGERAGTTLAPRSRDADRGCLHRDHHVRRGRRSRRCLQRRLAARDEFDPHRHPEGDDHRRSPVRSRARELAHHAGAAYQCGRGEQLGSAGGRGAQRPRAAAARRVRRAAVGVSRCRRRPTSRRDRSRSSRRSTPQPRPTAPSSPLPTSPTTRRIGGASRARSPICVPDDRGRVRAPGEIYRDPVYDGATDPTVVVPTTAGGCSTRSDGRRIRIPARTWRGCTGAGSGSRAAPTASSGRTSARWNRMPEA